MNDWRSCDNCKDVKDCLSAQTFPDLRVACKYWKPIRCRCSGALSETRYHNGRPYRHCYSCHKEFYLDDKTNDQSVVPVSKIFHRYTIYRCGSCGTRVLLKDKSCVSCGIPIDWDTAFKAEKGGKPHD